MQNSDSATSDPLTDTAGIATAFRRFGSTMIDELLYAIPESGLSELERYSTSSHAAFTICTSSIGCAIGTAIQYFITEDSDVGAVRIVVAVCAAIAIVSGGFGLLTKKHKNSYLKQLKDASNPVDGNAMLRLLVDAQRVTQLAPHKSADDQRTDLPEHSTG